VLSNNQLIEMHYGFIVDTVNKMYSKSLSSDVANDISIRLLGFDNEKLNKLHNDKEIQKYIYSIIRNERYNPRSISNRTYCECMVFNESIDNENVDILGYTETGSTTSIYIVANRLVTRRPDIEHYNIVNDTNLPTKDIGQVRYEPMTITLTIDNQDYLKELMAFVEQGISMGLKS